MRDDVVLPPEGRIYESLGGREATVQGLLGTVGISELPLEPLDVAVVEIRVVERRGLHYFDAEPERLVRAVLALFEDLPGVVVAVPSECPTLHLRAGRPA